jgi:hypothetical protein
MYQIIVSKSDEGLTYYRANLCALFCPMVKNKVVKGIDNLISHYILKLVLKTKIVIFP